MKKTTQTRNVTPEQRHDNFIHGVAGFILASMYFVYMFVILPRI